MEEGQGAGEDSEEWVVEMMVWCTSRSVRILILWKTSLSRIERKGVCVCFEDTLAKITVSVPKRTPFFVTMQQEIEHFGSHLSHAF